MRGLKLLLLIIRLTIGCLDKRSVVIRPSQLRAIGIESKHAKETRDSLISRGLITFAPKTDTYSINVEEIIRQAEGFPERKQALSKLISISLSQSGRSTLPKSGDSGSQNGVTDTPKMGADKIRSRLANKLDANSKDSSKDKVKDSDKDTDIAELHSTNENQMGFEPRNNDEYVALEAWRMVEPTNPDSFPFYISAINKKKVPADILFQIAHEVVDDSSIREKGKVFVSKVMKLVNQRKDAT